MGGPQLVKPQAHSHASSQVLCTPTAARDVFDDTAFTRFTTSCSALATGLSAALLMAYTRNLLASIRPRCTVLSSHDAHSTTQSMRVMGRASMCETWVTKPCRPAAHGEGLQAAQAQVLEHAVLAWTCVCSCISITRSCTKSSTGQHLSCGAAAVQPQLCCSSGCTERQQPQQSRSRLLRRGQDSVAPRTRWCTSMAVEFIPLLHLRLCQWRVLLL